MTGVNAQLGLAQETTSGTYLAPTRFQEFVSEDLKFVRDRIDSAALRARRTQHRRQEGRARVQGSIELELGPQGTGLILENLFGGTAVTTTIGSPVGDETHQHVITPGSLADKTLTLQVGRPSLDGTIHPFSYIGCKFTDWELSCAAGELLMLKASVFGQNESTTESLVSASYPAYIPFTFVDGSASVNIAGGGVTQICVTELSLSGNNNLKTDRHFIGTCTSDGLPKQAAENGKREYTGSYTLEFEDLTQYNAYKDFSQVVIQLVFTAPNSMNLVIDLTTELDGEGPVVEGPELLEQTINFTVSGGATDAANITATLQNADSSI